MEVLNTSFAEESLYYGNALVGLGSQTRPRLFFNVDQVFSRKIVTLSLRLSLLVWV